LPKFNPENPQLSDNLQRYTPEFDEEDQRRKLEAFTKEQLVDMLIYAYRLSSVFAKLSDERLAKLRRMREILDEPSQLSQMPDIPGPDDLRRMWEG